MRLLGLTFAAGFTFASAAGAMDLGAQHPAARALAFAPSHTPAATRTPAPVPGLTAGERLMLSSFALSATPGVAFGPPGGEEPATDGLDLDYRKSWPAAISLAVGRFDLDVSPHAALGAGSGGRSVEAGLMARFGQNLEESVSRRLGVRETGAFGNQGRWYIFAASSGESVGLNLLRRDGDWRRGGITKDTADALIGANQAGVGWRKGPMQASLGYVHREIKIRQGLEGLMGAGDRKDDLVALSFSFKPNE